MSIDCVKKGRAQLLYENGYKTVGAIAKAKPEELIQKIGKLNSIQARRIVNSAKVG